MNPIIDYPSALDYIYSFIDFSLTRDLRYSPEKFDLRRMIGFMEKLGNPQSQYKVIHVAGTKGKGSICAMITSILTQAGYTVGFYSSPHMIEFTERIRIGDELISKEDVVKYCNLLMPYIEKTKNLSTFEIITGIAFQYFADRKVDFAVVEVGMGGRLDATNVVNPVITAISSISIDHTRVLGDTIRKIAKEKAGIIKPGVPVVLANQKKAADEVVKSKAEWENAKLIKVNDCCKFEINHADLRGQDISITFNANNAQNYKIANNLNIFIPLLGDHQIENAIIAILIARELADMGYPISEKAIIKGIRYLKWQGRFEVIHENPLIIIDGAHNVDSFIKLRQTIHRYLAGKNITLLFGVSEDKQAKSMLKEIRGEVDYLIITQSSHPRAMDTNVLAKIAQQLGYDYTVEPDIKKAINNLLTENDPSKVIIASGSLFIAGAVKQIIKDQVLAHG